MPDLPNDENASGWDDLLESWTPDEAAAFFLEDTSPESTKREYWLSPLRSRLLRIVRRDAALWEGVCTAASRAFLSKRQLEGWLDAMDRVRGEAGAPDTPPASAPSVGERLLLGDAPWMQEILRSQNGTPRACLGNIDLLLLNHPDFQRDYWYDTFADRSMVDAEPMSDRHIDKVLRLLHTYRMPLQGHKPVEYAIGSACRLVPRDPLREWVESLPPWDQQPRVESMLSDLLGATNGRYEQAISRLMLMALIDRALNPGSLVRVVPILVGAQWIGKSSFVHWLGAPWTTDLSASLESKEAHMSIKGCWIAELTDLASLGKTSTERLKSFITLTKDDYVPKYSNTRVSYPRRTIFIGTHNPGLKAPLVDETGNTRFYPVTVYGPWQKPSEEYRRQLFSEALILYKCLLHSWWKLDEEVSAQLEQEREALQERSIYEEGLSQWLESSDPPHGWLYLNPHGTQPLCWSQIAEHYLQIPPERQKDRALQMQIAQALRGLGYERGRYTRLRGQNVRCYPWIKPL